MNVVHGYDAATKGGDLGRRVTASYWGSSGRRVQILSARPSAAGFGEPGSWRYRLFPPGWAAAPNRSAGANAWPRIWTRNTVEPMRTSGTGRDSLDG
jgi:hypothetical protein